MKRFFNKIMWHFAWYRYRQYRALHKRTLAAGVQAKQSWDDAAKRASEAWKT